MGSNTQDERELLSPLATPLVDITCINAVESLFYGNPKDPWGEAQARRFADIYVFSHQPRYPLPIPKERQDVDRGIPFLLSRLEELDRKSFVRENCTRDYGQRHLNPDYLESSFDAFSDWIVRNERQFVQLAALHNHPRIRMGQRRKNLGEGYFFNVTNVVRTAKVVPLASRVNVDPNDLLYLFDVVLRYPLYGEAAGEGNFYLAHPMREEQMLPTMQRHAMPEVRLPFSLGNVFSRVIGQLSADHYATLLHESRELLREHGVIDRADGTIDYRAASAFHDQMKLSVTLKGEAKALGVLGGVLTMLGAWPEAAGAVAIAGGAVTIASQFWSGGIPTVLAPKWLRCAVDWHVTVTSRRREY